MPRRAQSKSTATVERDQGPSIDSPLWIKA
jgi:hypothetical protein